MVAAFVTAEVAGKLALICAGWLDDEQQAIDGDRDQSYTVDEKKSRCRHLFRHWPQFTGIAVGMVRPTFNLKRGARHSARRRAYRRQSRRRP